MKKFFTLMLVFSVIGTFAQKGSVVSLQTEFASEITTTNQKSAPQGDVILPGNWADITGVGTYQWTDPDTEEILGWIFGNNAYDVIGVGNTFNGDYTIQGAYFWVGAAAEGAEEIKFGVYEFDGTDVGAELTSTTKTLDEIVAFPTADGVTPDQYLEAYYVEFETPATVSGDYMMVVDVSGVTYAAAGDGIGMVSSLVGAGGAGTAWIQDPTDGWQPATAWNAALEMDLGIFPVTAAGETGLFYEIFEEGVIPEGWLNVDADGDDYFWTIVDDGGGHVPYEGQYAIMSQSWDTAPLTPDNWLITHQIPNVKDSYELSFQVKAQDPDWPEEKYDVLISTTGTDLENFTSIHSETLTDAAAEWQEVVLTLEDFVGEDIYIAFRHWESTDWFQILLDAIKVEDTSTNVPVVISQDGFNVYPNPARDIMNVASDSQINELRIFDLSGRLVFSQSYNTKHVLVDVNDFNTGLYIMQIATDNDIKSVKFSVLK